MPDDRLFATLPVAACLPQLRQVLLDGRAAVLQAPPGAGKTTAVPLALLEAPWLAGKTILMLEPRRLAARASAARMAQMLGEPVGQTVGYRIRQEARVSAATRVEVVTEGILTRRLVADPELSAVGLVIFDEFHERSLNADLGLALCLEVQAALREDLRLLVMSATLGTGPVAALLGSSRRQEVPVVASEGRQYPVTTGWHPPEPRRRLEEAVASVVCQAVEEQAGSLLVFLPGESEIRRTASLLRGSNLPPEVDVFPLYGALGSAAQDQAIRPSPAGRRKVVLATSIAETSLTIDGISAVVDSGLARRPCFDPASGMSRLVTRRVSRAEADQRAGRAGRLSAGHCYRLWSRGEDLALEGFAPPEVLQADLAPLALDLAAWGSHEDSLAWLDAPPAGAMAQARDLLQRLGALDGRQRLTPHGELMSRLGAHPRLAHMMVRGWQDGEGATACLLAALLSGRDLPGGRDCDMARRVEMVLAAGRQQGSGAEAGLPGGRPEGQAALEQVRQLARDYGRRLRELAPASSSASPSPARPAAVPRLLALAWPDRIGRRRGSGSYTLSNGRGASFPEGEPLAASDWIVVAELAAAAGEAAGSNSRIRLASPLSLAEIEDLYGEEIHEHSLIQWSRQEDAVISRRQRRLWSLVLKDTPLEAAGGEEVVAAMIEGIRLGGLHLLPWDTASRQLAARMEFWKRQGGAAAADWPDCSPAGLLDSLEDWLAPFLGGMTRPAHLRKLDLLTALRSRLTWEQAQQLDRLAPVHFSVPSGDRIPLDYANGDVPVLAVRVQQMFGCSVHPAIGNGTIPLVVHLLSPARRPLQVTQDLPGFWSSSYAAVRAEMRGRYPRHPWPEDPRTALPTNRTKARENQG